MTHGNAYVLELVYGNTTLKQAISNCFSNERYPNFKMPLHSYLNTNWPSKPQNFQVAWTPKSKKFKEFKLVKKTHLSHNAARFKFAFPFLTPNSVLGLPVGKKHTCHFARFGKKKRREKFPHILLICSSIIQLNP